MRQIVAFVGAISFGCLVAVFGFWFVRTWLTRNWVSFRLGQINKVVSKRNVSDQKIISSSILQLEELAQLLDTTARHLRLGESLARAIQSAVATTQCTDQVLQGFARACSAGEAVDDVAQRILKTVKTNDQAFVIRTLELSATGGVGGVMAVERAAVVIRQRIVHIHDRHAQAAQALLSTRILSWTPLGVAVWLVITSGPVRHYLFISRSGWLCLLLGIGFNFAGRRWMAAIISPRVAK